MVWSFILQLRYPHVHVTEVAIVHLNSNETSCCSTTPYDYNTQICCDGVMGSLVEGHSTYCCSSAPYSYNSQMCCNYHVLDVQGNKKSCCDAELYNSSSHMCCNGRVSVRDGEGALTGPNCL